MTEIVNPPLLQTETLAGGDRFLDELPEAELFDTLLASQAKAVTALEKASTQVQAAISGAFTVLLRPNSRLIYCGAGTSGRVALLDAVELNPTFNWPGERIKVLLAGGEESFFEAQEGAEDDAEAARKALSALEPGVDDVIVGLAASGTTPFVLAVIDMAKAAGATTIGFSNNAHMPLVTAVDFPVLLDTGAEALAGSTRLAAGTSQKIALNIFSTALMVRLGKVYRGRMVDMRVTNRKLQNRAIAMVADIVGCGEDLARQALEKTGFDVKHAVLVARGATPSEAMRALKASDGILSSAVRRMFG
ncbi:N-acetylmuramic acid 6-phosphate etherase [Chelatococcus asaccharovorans]|uniref:N-acetylmuramic acid 6-phosphate etherase n=2 Tax=Chelatococcus asaccharovorans TaxID=28210 RepID=A0A2V3U9U0_9HYPH|nr:N-acetylmuramic acid 6-phosphate etherase [Chelatococcus asaccharovorans]PXW60170.1 N-acetylmuramic acid 6-phosphate etherase [Chelatococcus asaccharovorans]CAH1655468.1 N-acetylmuramic acid 6-phosphate etherase [Chelatococcus asaccharovorans]CAH1685415.1 N-acetylmuramic acid 6-phosphate etherase [Chelatococcus asaccharovorans]